MCTLAWKREFVRSLVDYAEVRVSDIGCAFTSLRCASAPLDRVDGLEDDLVDFCQVPTVADASPGLFVESAHARSGDAY